MAKKPLNQPADAGVQIEREQPSQFPLTRTNFIMMIVAGVMIVLGFCLMLGGSTTTEAFNPDIFSTRRIVVGPTLSFLGFVAMAVAIVWRPRSEKA
jgi:hypothetical protein